jgi:Zn-dependent peptidase ImmA (M78 family)/transcriptional regulator with XRE-family HTH domain
MTSFNSEMLILAREFRGFTQTELATKISATQATVSKIEAGLLSPEGFLGKFSDALTFPIEFFQQSDRVFGFNSTVFFHRKRQALPDKILRRLHASMNIVRMRVHRLLRSASDEKLGRFSFRRIELEDYGNKPEEVARLVRSMWHVAPGPIRSMIELIEDAGGIIVSMDFGTRQADAVSEWIPGFPPIFLINSAEEVTGDRLRLTLAHEVAHALLHAYPNPAMEEQANEFAAEFMMPRREIKASLYNLTLIKLAQLKRIWKVSMAALIQRAHELKTITDNQRRYLFMALSKRGQRLREPIETDIPIERPTKLMGLVKSHVELGYSNRDLMKLIFISDEDEFRSSYLGINKLRLIG